MEDQVLPKPDIKDQLFKLSPSTYLQCAHSEKSMFRYTVKKSSTGNTVWTMETQDKMNILFGEK